MSGSGGWSFTDPREIFYYKMYKYFKQGIPTRVYRKEYSKDIDMVLAIDNAVEQKEYKNQEVYKELMNM